MVNITSSMTQQEACPHAAPTYKYRGDTGNWDKSDDKYWIDWACTDCGKRWQTPQDQGEVKRYPGAVDITR